MLNLSDITDVFIWKGIGEFLYLWHESLIWWGQRVSKCVCRIQEGSCQLWVINYLSSGVRVYGLYLMLMSMVRWGCLYPVSIIQLRNSFLFKGMSVSLLSVALCLRNLWEKNVFCGFCMVLPAEFFTSGVAVLSLVTCLSLALTSDYNEMSFWTIFTNIVLLLK